MLKPNNNPSIFNVYDELIRGIKSSLNCIKVGKIINYDASTQQADIELFGKWKNRLTNKTEQYPLLQGVPMLDLGGKSYLHIPVNIGDECLVLFSDTMIDEWYATGTSQFPLYYRYHDISDGFGITGIRSLGNIIQGLENFITLFYSDSSKIVMNDESVTITNPQVNMSENLTVSGAIVGETTTTSELHDSRGISGVFVDTGLGATGMKLTIQDGIIVGIG